ncbi:type II toxin-antitoxin system PemK/MazF family toxin [Actinacidiphila sp. bgisy144]|uniref:type II toxin-antitoxin system PemK/MazF family toxin n=1 Tax=Actinacidiphila sp. bgisy144 TaxID=3413791 RepID=UPI003EB9A33C
MSGGMWAAVLAVAALALVAAVVDGRARSRRPPRGARGGAGPGPGRGPAPRQPRQPRRGEVWWARVPFEDGPGGKDRPCLVLSVRGGSARVAKITTKRHAGLPGVLALPPGTVDDAAGRQSYLETGELRDVPLPAFRRRAGALDPGFMKRLERR